MTDKEQIIDGINVSECDRFREGYCLTGTGVCYKCDTNCQYAAYYLKEQLQRKTHECEELKAYAQRQENQRETYYKEYLKLSQECEELKKECEEYKYNAESYCNSYQSSCKVNGEITHKMFKYKQALEEIENIISEMKYVYIENVSVSSGFLSHKISLESSYRFYKILNIISKAKGEKKCQ